MLSISHSLTGAFIASKLPHPVLYIPLILASHYLEDWIPHRDVGTGLSSGKRKVSHVLLLEVGELILSGLLIFFFWRHLIGNQIWIHIWIGAFLGLVPDFLEAPRNFLKWEPFFLKPFNNFHQQFHHSTFDWLIGLGPQLALWVGIFLLR